MDFDIQKYLKRFFTRPKKNEVYVIVSSGRTGTKFLSSMFSEIFGEKCLSLHEPHPDFFSIGVDYHRKKISREELIAHIKKERQKFIYELNKQNKNIFIESNPNLSFILDAYKSAFKEVKVIHVVRDPRDYVLSAFSKSPDGSGKFFFMDENDHRDRLKPQDFNEENIFENPHKITRFELILWHWKKTNELIYEFSINNPNRYVLLRYEDIFSSQRQIQETSFNTLCSFFNLSTVNYNDIKGVFDQKINATKKDYRLEVYENWSEENKRLFNFLIEDEELNNYGYQ